MVVLVAPVQVLEHEDDGRCGRHRLEEGADLPEHALGRRRQHGAMEPGRLGLGQEPRDLHVPARRDTPEERDQGGAGRGAEAPLERLQDGHVWLALPVLLDALPAEHPHIGTMQRGGSEELLRERRLADARLTRDEDDLSRPTAGESQTPVKPPEFRLPSHEGGSRLVGGDVVRQRRGGGPTARPPRVALEPADLGHEAEAPPVDGLDDPRRARVVIQGLAKLADRFGERVVGDDDVGPDLAVEGVLGDEQTGPLDQIAEHVPGFGAEGDFAIFPPQAVAGQVQLKGVEHEPSGSGERRGVAHRAFGAPSGERSEKSRKVFRIAASVLCKPRPW